ncbi:hypothetical protein KZ820_18545 [Sphingomonas sp. RRHST34]|uniref:Uncharacterized protein n=1 Tax=Sphingomonas citri TaxID=2862499 RepID=A0ABS7BT23_9SPHN|nr:hypothetical protein [Sphingomonas citri]MBW6532747.1 hypothetical protein [Sphingomonas citri]
MASISAHRTDNHEPLDLPSNLLFGFSWMLVMAVGLMPIAEACLHRVPSVTVPATAAFFIAVGSGILLRRRYSWVGVVLHIYGQIAIWLSLFVMSLAGILASLGS